MTASPDGKLACTSCGKRFKWSPKIAGKRVQCTCGAIMRVPLTAPHEATDQPPAAATTGSEPASRPARSVAPPPKPAAPAEGESYELELNHPDDTPATPAPRATAAGTPGGGGSGSPSGGGSGGCPSCNSPVKPTAVICLNCGFNLKSGTKVKTSVGDAGGAAKPLGGMMLAAKSAGLNTEALAEDVAKQHRFKEVYLPLICLGVGVFLTLLNAFVLYPLSLEAAPANPFTGQKYDATMMDSLYSLAFTGLRWVVQMPILLAAIFIVARLFGSSYGPILPALLKLAAFGLVVGVLGDSVGAGLDIMTGGFAWMGWSIKFAVVFGAFWWLASALFDMDGLEILVMYVLMVFAPFLIMGLLAGVLMAIFA